MRFLTFAATWVGLGVIVALGVAVPGPFPTLAGGSSIPRLTAPRCLALAYRGPVDTHWMPAVIRLDTTADHMFDRADHPGYQGLAVSGTVYAGWRDMGRDSIDFGGLAFPVFRLPSRVLESAEGEVVVGRGGYYDWKPLAFALLEANRFEVRARAVPCK